jgi:hypothetical protein
MIGPKTLARIARKQAAAAAQDLHPASKTQLRKAQELGIDLLIFKAHKGQPGYREVGEALELAGWSFNGKQQISEPEDCEPADGLL